MTSRSLLIFFALTILGTCAVGQTAAVPPWDYPTWFWVESLNESSASWLNTTYSPTIPFRHHRHLRSDNELIGIPKDVFNSNAANMMPSGVHGLLSVTSMRLLDISTGTDYIWMPSIPGPGVPLSPPLPTGTCKLYSIECGFTQPTGSWILTYPFATPSPASNIDMHDAALPTPSYPTAVNGFGSNVFGRYFASNFDGNNNPGWSDVERVKSFDDGYDVAEALPTVVTPFTPECKSLNFAFPSPTASNFLYFVADFSNPLTHDFFNAYLNDPANATTPLVTSYAIDNQIVPCGASIYKLPLNATSLSQLSYYRTWKQLGLTPYDQISGIAIRANGSTDQRGVQFSLTADSPSLEIWALKIHEASIVGPPQSFYTATSNYGALMGGASTAIAIKAPMPQSTFGETAPLRYDGHYMWLNRDSTVGVVEFWSGPGYFELPAFDITTAPSPMPLPGYVINGAHQVAYSGGGVVPMPSGGSGAVFPILVQPPNTYPGIDAIRSQDPWDKSYGNGGLGYIPLTMRTYDTASGATVSADGTFMGAESTEMVIKTGNRFEINIAAPTGLTFNYNAANQWDIDFVVFWCRRADHPNTASFLGVPMVFNPIIGNANQFFDGAGGILWTNVNFNNGYNAIPTIMGYNPATNVTHAPTYIRGYMDLTTQAPSVWHIDTNSEIECQMFMLTRTNPPIPLPATNAVAVKLSQVE